MALPMKVNLLVLFPLQFPPNRLYFPLKFLGFPYGESGSKLDKGL